MRTSLRLGLVLAFLFLWVGSPARAQVMSQEARVVGAGVVRVTTEWRERRGQRRAVVTARAAGGTATLHDGPTVRTAVAASGETLLLVAFHGGEHAFVRTVVARLEAGRFTVGAPVEIPRAPEAIRRGLRPASALACQSPGGFTVLVQEQDPSNPQADVVTTLAQVGLDGALAGPPVAAAIPWGPAALAWSGEAYHLAVLFGGWGGAGTGTARVCLVTLSPAGAPREHPWWSSPAEELADVQLVPRAGGVEQVWRRSDGTVQASTWTAPGQWGVEPPGARSIGQVPLSEPLLVTLRDGQAVLGAP